MVDPNAGVKVKMVTRHEQMGQAGSQQLMLDTVEMQVKMRS